VSVRKCKKCDTLIGAKDKHYTLIDSIKAERRESDRAAKKELARIKAAATKNETKQQNASSTDETGFTEKKLSRFEEMQQLLFADETEFTEKILSRYGNATAQLIDDNLVQIVGGTEEEQATCVKWVKEKHPEYQII
ncbi:uncharacterized protein METZ01_LOCUS517677, partial [marine metagenome]